MRRVFRILTMLRWVWATQRPTYTHQKPIPMTVGMGFWWVRVQVRNFRPRVYPCSSLGRREVGIKSGSSTRCKIQQSSYRRNRSCHLMAFQTGSRPSHGFVVGEGSIHALQRLAARISHGKYPGNLQRRFAKRCLLMGADVLRLSTICQTSAVTVCVRGGKDTAVLGTVAQYAF